MKILFVGYHNPSYPTMTQCIEKAIADLGHALETFDYRSWLIPGRIRSRMSFLEHWDLQRINNEIVKKAVAFCPDLLLVNGGYTISQETIGRIKRQLPSVKTVNWIADYPLQFDTYCKTGPSYDLFFTSGTDSLEKYRALGHTNGHWLPFACDPDLHRRVSLTPAEKELYRCDIGFVGGNYTERRELLEQITDYDIGIWGVGWDRLPHNSPLRKKVRGNAVSLDEWVKIYNTSKIVLNIIGHRCDVMEPYVEEKDFKMTNTKVFEILGCGAFELVDAKADVLSLFENRKHLCVYSGARDLRMQLNHFLHSPQERSEIAAQGHSLVLGRHTYRHRISEMLEVAGLV